MKKLLALGISSCLLFSFTGSAFAASPTNTHAKKKIVHAAVSKKHTAHMVNGKKKAIHSAAGSKITKNHTKKHAVTTGTAKHAVHKKNPARQPQNA